MKNIQSKYKLHNDVEIPCLGFGVFQVKDEEECISATLAALHNGYRSIDTATRYENEAYIGKAIKGSGLAREDLFITTKVWVSHHGYNQTREAFQKSLTRLQLDYIDMYLIHWPAPGYLDTWKALEDLYEEGLIRAIGVCNFQIHHLQNLMDHAKINPMLNQIETHPCFQQEELREFMAEHEIAHEAWSPLGQGKNDLFTHPILVEIGKKYNQTSAQVMLRWHLQRNTIIIPKSVRESRIKENANIFDFHLTESDMEKIKSLDTKERFFGDPDKEEWIQFLLDQPVKE